MNCAFGQAFLLALIFFTVYWILLGFLIEWSVKKYRTSRERKRHAKYAENHFRNTERYRRDITG